MQAGQQRCTAAPACSHTAKAGRAVFFCLLHSPCAARPAPSGSIRFTVEVLSSCVCDGSAPLERGGCAEPAQTIYPGKHKGRHQPWSHTGQQLCQGGLERGRTSPKGHHGSSVAGLFVPSEQEQQLQPTIRLTLLWYFLWESHNLHPSHSRGCSWKCRITLRCGAGQKRQSTTSQDSNGGKLW